METILQKDVRDLTIKYPKEHSPNLHFDYTTYYPYGNAGRLSKIYEENGGSTINRRKELFNTIKENFKEEIIGELAIFARKVLEKINSANPRDKNGKIVNPFVFDESGFSSLGAIKRVGKKAKTKVAELKSTKIGFTYVRLNLAGFVEALSVRLELVGYYKEDGRSFNEEELARRTWVKKVDVYFYPIVSNSRQNKNCFTYSAENRQARGEDFFENIYDVIAEYSYNRNTFPSAYPSLRNLRINTEGIKYNDENCPIRTLAKSTIIGELYAAKDLYNRLTEGGDYCWVMEKINDKVNAYVNPFSNYVIKLNDFNAMANFLIKLDSTTSIKQGSFGDIDGFYVYKPVMEKFMGLTTEINNPNEYSKAVEIVKDDVDLDAPIESDEPPYQAV